METDWQSYNIFYDSSYSTLHSLLASHSVKASQILTCAFFLSTAIYDAKNSWRDATGTQSVPVRELREQLAWTTGSISKLREGGVKWEKPR